VQFPTCVAVRIKEEEYIEELPLPVTGTDRTPSVERVRRRVVARTKLVKPIANIIVEAVKVGTRE
jgi:hypothetical protein